MVDYFALPTFICCIWLCCYVLFVVGSWRSCFRLFSLVAWSSISIFQFLNHGKSRWQTIVGVWCMTIQTNLGKRGPPSFVVSWLRTLLNTVSWNCHKPRGGPAAPAKLVVQIQEAPRFSGGRCRNRSFLHGRDIARLHGWTQILGQSGTQAPWRTAQRLHRLHVHVPCAPEGTTHRSLQGGARDPLKCVLIKMNLINCIHVDGFLSYGGMGVPNSWMVYFVENPIYW